MLTTLVGTILLIIIMMIMERRDQPVLPEETSKHLIGSDVKLLLSRPWGYSFLHPLTNSKKQLEYGPVSPQQKNLNMVLFRSEEHE